MFIKNIITKLSLSALTFMFYVDSTLAYGLPRIGYLPGGSSGDSQDGVIFAVNNLFQGIANGLALVAGAIAVLSIAINGGRLVFSFGETEALNTAKKQLLWSIGGLIIIIFAYILVKSIMALVYSGE